MSLHVVTYATHSQGMFDNLVNNDHGVKIKVLGWGEKWKYYRQKIVGVLEYTKTLPLDDIIVFVDGFDTEVCRPLDNFIEDFKRIGKDFVISLDPELGGNFLTRRIFGTCQNKFINSGLYCGYVWKVIEVLEGTMNFKCKDDQRNLTSVCNHSFHIDSECNLFENSNYTSSTCYFRSFPCELSFKRYVVRAVKEYTQFFIMEVLIVLGLLAYYWNPYVALGILSFLLMYCDFSCIF